LVDRVGQWHFSWDFQVLAATTGFVVDRRGSGGFTAGMRVLLPTLLLASVWVSGCATKTEPVFQPVPGGSSAVPSLEGASPANKTKTGEPSIVTPDTILTGRVAVYNEAGRFVVLDFPIGHLPANEQVLFVFRLGLKVGEVKVTGPRRDHNTVADLVSGEARKGDEVRDR
jgi:hypothetical protein